ncbi:MAG: Arm DNA-binding domain-containing protein, partial [Gammaproteobacteria bacterium]
MLTDKAIRALQPTEKPRKVADSLGLYLLIQPNGSRLWRFKYRFGPKKKDHPQLKEKNSKGRGEKLVTLGAYPEVG